MSMQAAAPDEVRQQLERTLASRTFSASARLRAFLRYVVEQTLDGNGGHLKEYAIGTEVFDRDEQYDPRIDSIVRVEAGRLRTKLDEYYAGEGAADRIVIRIDRGGYMPVFETREVGPAPVRRGRWQAVVLGLLAAALAVSGAAGWFVNRSAATLPPARPFAVAVLPFTHYAPGNADEALAARLTDAVTSELARINTVGVISRTSALEASRAREPLPQIARRLNANSLIEGSVVSEGDVVRVRTRIVDGVADLKSAVRDFEGRRDDPDALAIRIAQALSAALQAR